MAVSRSPALAVPVMAGGAETTGATGAALTIAVAGEVAGAPEPPAPMAISRTRSVWPTSAAVSR